MDNKDSFDKLFLPSTASYSSSFIPALLDGIVVLKAKESDKKCNFDTVLCMG
jgi:hypothetical protein